MDREHCCVVNRIIPPHTEGTLLTSYSIAEERESSLRIRRVLGAQADSTLNIRIIPPHTEGTFSSVVPADGTGNHPSAYGGYCILPGLICRGRESSLRIRRVQPVASYLPKLTNESSLRIRRVQTFQLSRNVWSGIIPPHTEGTLPYNIDCNRR